MPHYSAATQPTLYFIGVTTASSSIMRVFPKWAEYLGLTNATIKGIDFPPHSPAQAYREAVDFIKNDPLSLGALVTTHKIDLFDTCKDMFDYIDPYAQQLGEVSSISKRGDKLCAHAKDPISSGLALEHFVPANFWAQHKGQVMLMGAGGSSLAMSVYFTQSRFAGNMPQKIIITNRSLPRLQSAEQILVNKDTPIPFAFLHTPTPQDNDRVLASLPPYSLIVNATGLGKDGPGSPLTDQCQFPENSLVWEINYRGELLFMEQANRQKQQKHLHVEDGWVYFIHGWTQVIAEVFDIAFDEDKLEACSRIAKEA